ncbi:hypothetical protein VIN01S_10050 [Vibrio inusitatus NBRC 102082]|uniref:Uncharacterized protein n=1 Tax=Vibrio inusitatus NBRC 102082 TaxID=1219070 RepID=A0A4Y3HTA2_9VIBR|nr:hypothetical protein [Vibrio inusitatus]GEA50201.1 hypothetical protein VIN01S_10050 [Vibrio inusitatus NBRC 102082]
MEISKSAIAVAISATFLFGCDFDVGEDSSGGGSEPTTPTSEVIGPLWNFEDASGASTQAIGLPNVYVFDGTNLKYYDDDATPNTYEIKLTPYTDDAEAGEITFTYYDEAGTGSEVSGTYTVDNGVFTVDTASEGVLIGADDTSNADIKAAVDAANADAGFNNYVQIIDTSDTDTGELRLKLADNDFEPITSGKVTVDLVYQEDEDSIGDANSKNAYISLYASGTSTTNLHGEIALEAGKIKYRDNNKALVEIVGTYEEGEDLSIEANWDDGVFNFKVNDVEHSYTANEIPENAPVEIVAIRLGDNGSTNNYEVLADNLKVYSNDSGSEALIFEDNFDSYSVGTILNSKPYNNNSSEAVVVGNTPEEPADPVDPPAPGEITDNFDSYTIGTQIDAANSDYIVNQVDGSTNNIASISDVVAKSGSNSLYLEDNNGNNIDTGTKPVVSRYFKGGAASSGSVSTSVYIPADGYVKSSYLFLGTSESASSSARFTEIAFGSSEVKFRNQSGSQKALANYEQDTWVDVTVAWVDTAITVTINGEEFTSYVDSEVEYDLVAENDTGAPTLFAVYNGDGKTTGTYTYFDDLDSELF